MSGLAKRDRIQVPHCKSVQGRHKPLTVKEVGPETAEVLQFGWPVAANQDVQPRPLSGDLEVVVEIANIFPRDSKTFLQ